MSKFKRKLDIAKARQKLAKEPQKLEIVTADQKEMAALHNDLNDLAALLQNVLTDNTFKDSVEANLTDLNNAVVLLTQAISDGLMIKNQPVLDEVVVSNLKDIKIPDEIRVKNPSEFPKDLATNKNIKDFQAAIVKALDKVRVAVKEGVSIPDGPVKQEVADYTPSRRVVMKGHTLKFDDSAISDLRIPVPLPSFQNQAGQATRVTLNADGSIPTSGGGGSGGGAATIADGADVAEGATTDAAVTAGSAGTVSGKLRQISSDVSSVKTNTANNATTAKQDTGNTSLASIDTKVSDVATQTTLALIKAKTDNIDVALSTRTKPADAQHVIVDSGVTTGLTDTQLRANPVPISNSAASSAALTNVSSAATSTSLLASNSNRRGANFYNDSAASLYLKFGATASSTSFTIKIGPNGYYEMPLPTYTGAIDGIWTAVDGAVRITELT